MNTIRRILKVSIFLAIAAGIFVWINYLVQPLWKEWNTYDTVNGFYKEPENTIETIFLGTSVSVNGITPMELYEEYGICSYNLGTQMQSMFTSYTWLQEAYRLQSKTLDTVVIDVGGIRREIDDSFTHKALDGMELSTVKLSALYDYTQNANDFITSLIPVLSYHDRWKELEKPDFQKKVNVPRNYVRGYNFITDSYLDEVGSYRNVAVPTYYLDEQAKPSTFLEEHMKYFVKLVQFCKEKNLNLILVKSPQVGSMKWTSADHNGIQKLADQYELDFLDFNFLPYIDAYDYNCATDTMDGRHMNYTGASKYTKCIGGYLINKYGNTDIRGTSGYEFMEKELKDYKREIISGKLSALEDPIEYFDALKDYTKYSVIVTVSPKGAEGLTDEQKIQFAKLGLTGFLNLDENSFYMAVFENGKVISQKICVYDEESTETASIAGTFANKKPFSVVSNGLETLFESDRAKANMVETGINIVLYDETLKKIVDTITYNLDTANTSSLAQNQYLYEQACKNEKLKEYVKNKLGENDYSGCIQAYAPYENYAIFVSGTDANGNTYLAVLRGGEVIEEQKGNGAENIEITGAEYKLASGDTSSILLNYTEYASKDSGIQVVVYDNITDTVIDTYVFTSDNIQ